MRRAWPWWGSACLWGCGLIGGAGDLVVVQGEGGNGGGAGANCQPSGAELCSNGLDDDCNGAADCADDACSDASCEALGLTCGTQIFPCTGELLSCDNEEQDGEETDVDCGGPIEACIRRCTAGELCGAESDCASTICDDGRCQPPVCGDGEALDTEECDDGDQEGYDGCSAYCLDEADHLLISEIVLDDEPIQFIEIHNPTAEDLDVEQVYLADYAGYHLITGGGVPATDDFAVRFPAGTQIPAGGFVMVAIGPYATVLAEYGVVPDFDLGGTGATAEDMVGSFGPSSSCHKDNGLIILFQWDDAASTVEDLDYMIYGDGNAFVDKTGSPGYLPDTPRVLQTPIDPAPKGRSLYRCDTSERSETRVGGNGVTGHDETSEHLLRSFTEAMAPTPGAPPDNRGRCP